MKIITVLFLGLLPLISNGQDMPKYSFHVEGGYLSNDYVKEALRKGINSKDENRNHKCIILDVGMQIRISKDWRIGPSFTYDHFGTKHRSVEFSILSFLLKADRIWKETRTFTFHSGIALGIKSKKKFVNNILISRSTRLGCQFDLAGIGLKLGQFNLYNNIGWGTSGFFSTGIRYSFK